jgi:hypothetical protein
VLNQPVVSKWHPIEERLSRDDRERYIEALGEADRGHLSSLVVLFSALERKAFVNALGIAREVPQEEERVEQVLRGLRA